MTLIQIITIYLCNIEMKIKQNNTTKMNISRNIENLKKNVIKNKPVFIHFNNNKSFTCRCRLGWQGPMCKQCAILPGCVHGTCQGPLECRCEPGWTGFLCSTRKCNSWKMKKSLKKNFEDRISVADAKNYFNKTSWKRETCGLILQGKSMDVRSVVKLRYEKQNSSVKSSLEILPSKEDNAKSLAFLFRDH